MTESAVGEQAIELSIGSPELAGPVLERLVSAAAARAELPVDRVVNALTVVDVLVHAVDSALPGQPRSVRVTFSAGSLEIVLDNLVDGQAESVRDAAVIPGVGNTLDQTATTITIEHEGSRSALVISLD
jgi:serine/threonine-protein kinase RsbW